MFTIDFVCLFFIFFKVVCLIDLICPICLINPILGLFLYYVIKPKYDSWWQLWGDGIYHITLSILLNHLSLAVCLYIMNFHFMLYNYYFIPDCNDWEEGVEKKYFKDNDVMMIANGWRCKVWQFNILRGQGLWQNRGVLEILDLKLFGAEILVSIWIELF